MKHTTKQIITEKISSGAFLPGQRLPAERSIASDLGVSRTSVQLALKELEAEGLLRREPNCRPVLVQRLPSKAVRNQVAVWMLPELQDLGGMLMLRGIRSVLSGGQFSLLMGCPPATQSVEQAEVEFFQSALNNEKLAGLIVWDSQNSRCKKIYEQLLSQRVPLVFIDRMPSYQVPVDFVGVDNFEAARDAVQHLVGMRHERIAFLARESTASSVRGRIAGYRVALQEAGLPVDERLIVDYPGEDEPVSTEVCQDLIKKLLGRPNPPSAIFAANDAIALHLLEAARNLRLKVPEQISIVGFDWLLRNLPSGGDLTTVAQPFEEIGRAAAQRILDRIASTEPQSPRKILFQANLVLRGSTSPPGNHDLPL